MPCVDVLLATYNGARYLPDLLRSLEAQTHQNWRLIVRDDGSSDNSLAIIEDWSRMSERDVEILKDGDRGLGAMGNFSRLLAASDGPYFAFCDQDDIWLPEKISRLLDETRLAENELGPEAPVLTHCDLTVVDKDLRVTSGSFWQQQGFKIREVRAGDSGAGVRRSLVIRNFVTGCAMLGNAKLRAFASPVPPHGVMHDWWVALVAAYLGEIRTVDDPGILYRQHGSNTLGAKGWGPLNVLNRVRRRPRAAIARTLHWLADSRNQAAEFLLRHKTRLAPDDAAFLEAYSQSGHASLFSRKAFLIRHRVWPQSTMRALIMVVFM